MTRAAAFCRDPLGDSRASVLGIEIETERLLMRRWREDDKTPFAAICADPHVMKWIGNGATRSPEQAVEAIRSFEMGWKTKGYGLFAVELKETGELLGLTGLSTPHFLPDILPAVEIGWRFARQSSYEARRSQEVCSGR